MARTAAHVLLLVLAAPAAAPAEPAAASPLEPYYQFLHWVSMGQVDRAAEWFAPDAVVVAGPGCTPADPCVGHTAIRERYLVPLTARRAALPMTDQRFDGRRLHTREARVTARFDGQPLAWQAGHVVDFAGGRIAALRLELQPEAPAGATAATIAASP